MKKEKKNGFNVAARLPPLYYFIYEKNRDLSEGRGEKKNADQDP